MADKGRTEIFCAESRSQNRLIDRSAVRHFRIVTTHASAALLPLLIRRHAGKAIKRAFCRSDKKLEGCSVYLDQWLVGSGPCHYDLSSKADPAIAADVRRHRDPRFLHSSQQHRFFCRVCLA